MAVDTYCSESISIFGPHEHQVLTVRLINKCALFRVRFNLDFFARDVEALPHLCCTMLLTID